MSGRWKTVYSVHDFPEVDMWLRSRANEQSKERAKHARIAMEQFDAFLVVNDLELEQIDNKKMRYFSHFLADEDYGNLAHSTVAKRWYAVRQYLNEHVDSDVGWLEGDDWILKWLDRGTETARQLDLEIHWLPLDMIPKLIEGASQHPITPERNELIVRMLWNTGCRPSEIARMKERRVDMKNRSIKVQNSKVKDTRADNFEKTVFFSRATRRLLRDWLHRGGRDSLTYASESNKLFPGYNTEEISARQVNSIVRQAADAAEIQEDTIKRADGVSINRITPKALRHSFAVHSVRGRELSGTPAMDLETLRQIMGHKSLETVREYLQFRQTTTRNTFDACFPD
jgi:integrase/recombinase XerD